jgi:AcrR family transcriptional regulator
VAAAPVPEARPGPDTRTRIIEAAHERVALDGVTRTTIESVAHHAGLSRATIYRYFPGGRDELAAAVVSWEVGRFFTQLRADADGAEATDFASWLARRLEAARRLLAEHDVLQEALELEADQVLPPLVSVMPIVQGMLRDELAERLEAERLRPGVDRGQAADLLARLLLSFTGTAGCWQLDDPAEVDRLVRTQLLAGILAD